jgi:hypothetical protein
MIEGPNSLPTPALVDAATLIDEQQIGRFHIAVLLLCASSMFVDGTYGAESPARSLVPRDISIA